MEAILARRHQRSLFDTARDELFSHIHRCAVLEADAEHQREWFEETLEFMRERYPDLSPAELNQLQELGLRFCQPPIPHGPEYTAINQEDADAA
jgi:hypothetical protein